MHVEIEILDISFAIHSASAFSVCLVFKIHQEMGIADKSLLL